MWTPARRFVRLRASEDDGVDGTTSTGREISITTSLTQGDVVVQVPKGQHSIYVGLWERGFYHVKNGAPGADGPVMDHFNATVVKRYLDHMGDALVRTLLTDKDGRQKGVLGDHIRAFFVDSLELDWMNWTDDFAAEFRKRRGYALDAYLPFVLDIDVPKLDDKSPFAENVRRARQDMSRTVNELFHERFVQTFVACASHGALARAQAYGREAHPLDASRLTHLPEGETWLWHDEDKQQGRGGVRIDSAVVNRYVASAAHFSGAKALSFEAMTNTVPVSWTTLEDFKAGVDRTFMDGLNHPIFHGYNYSPPDAKFPGWIKYGSCVPGEPQF